MHLWVGSSDKKGHLICLLSNNSYLDVLKTAGTFSKLNFGHSSQNQHYLRSRILDSSLTMILKAITIIAFASRYEMFLKAKHDLK